MMTIGTNDKNSLTPSESLIFFSKTIGKTRDNHVTKPQPTMVVKIILEESMFDKDPRFTSNDGYNNNY